MVEPFTGNNSVLLWCILYMLLFFLFIFLYETICVDLYVHFCVFNVVVSLFTISPQAFHFPEGVGVSVGAPGDPSDYVLEVHYSKFTDSLDVNGKSNPRILISCLVMCLLINPNTFN